ncbi:MAG: TRAP transporter small permease [Pseudomonadota bacterium]|jgi:TRAP-type C4-dicarboxylate transport system permease small subunit|uniref:TRAP transporter small permease n=1 Tax=Thalassococcus sp. TaxID=1928858 RepID=UPI001B1FE58F|nr:TRAP transporter small permease [Thalassococcus sp.]MBO6865890.1 TRAP transporter small permease [Thalassococcus sp.]MEC7669450.1 TRAP transporter small permease [Pseudomonadota bacterium]MEC8580992.1 TRAP transporter small permease [Pseudomonadota bacterium]
MLTLVEKIARFTAILGGLILTVLVVLTCISVIGRGLNTFGHSDFLEAYAPAFGDMLLATGVAPITGDFELVEAGVAFAIFSFLPICQLYGAHATVDIFTSMLSKRVNEVLMIVWEIALTAIVILITWRLFEGMQDKMKYGETTFLLQFPIWQSYAASLVPAVIASLVGVYCSYARIIGFVTGHTPLPNSEGAVH